MAEDIGKLLDLLDNAEIARLYKSTIRQMQPADLVRRLESEKVSTRGHMPELRGRLLRLEARKLGLKVPWFKEDEHEALKKGQQDHAARVVHSVKVSKLRKTVLMKNDHLPAKKTRRKDTADWVKMEETKGYTERVLKGASDALHKMINSITDKDFFDSMSATRKTEKRGAKTKSGYTRL